ncbi:MAG: nuclear transport factor 2 family protein [Deltaproteobacteria bacterium]|nr:nuclear transport factor 2 family protein [Deltaproteobacteria bacterium]
MTEAKYRQYIADFNAACAGSGKFDTFFDTYYHPDAVFEYIPAARKNQGRASTLKFWEGVHEIMTEEIQPHISLLITDNQVATEAPIDFRCKKDLDWVGVKHPAGSSFRLRMVAFYDLDEDDKITYVRVYSIYHEAYQVG